MAQFSPRALLLFPPAESFLELSVKQNQPKSTNQIHTKIQNQIRQNVTFTLDFSHGEHPGHLTENTGGLVFYYSFQGSFCGHAFDVVPRFAFLIPVGCLLYEVQPTAWTLMACIKFLEDPLGG